MSARYIPATTAEVIDKLNLIVERTNSPAEILECLFEILQSDGSWGNRLEDLFKRYRSFWGLIGSHTLQKLDKRHQAMFALVAKHEEGWERTFLEIVCDTKRYTPETRSLFAVFVIGPQTPHLSHFSAHQRSLGLASASSKCSNLGIPASSPTPMTSSATTHSGTGSTASAEADATPKSRNASLITVVIPKRQTVMDFPTPQ